MTAFDCDQFHDLAPDLALGLLAGHERGAAVNHLAACARCRHQLEGLVQVADDLLLLAPSVEPEIGFESRVMARLAADGAFVGPPSEPRKPTAEPAPAAQGASPPVTPDIPLGSEGPRRRRGRATGARHWPGRSVLVGVAVALVVIAGTTGLVAAMTRGGNGAGGRQTRAADPQAARTVVIRADAGRSTCQLVAFPANDGRGARLVINLDEPTEPTSAYQVLAEPTGGGPAVLVGTIAVRDGHGMLAADIPAGTGPVDAVRIVEASQSIRYRATFESV